MFEFWREATVASVPGLLCQSSCRRPEKGLNLKFPNKYVEDGVAEEVPYEQYAPADGCPVFYLPHHAVIREDKQTTKTRVVFDASERDLNGVSLNSCLEAGPALHPDLVGILLRFRKNQVGSWVMLKRCFCRLA